MPNRRPKTVHRTREDRSLRVLKRGVSALAVGIGLGFAIPALAQPTNFVVDISDPNVDVDLSVLNDGGLSPQMPAPMPTGQAPATTGMDGDAYRTPGKDVPVSTLYIKPTSPFKLPPQTKAIETALEPQTMPAPAPSPAQPVMTVSAPPPAPVDVKPVPESLAQPEQVASAPPPPPAVEAPAAVSEPTPEPQVAEVAPPPPAPEPAPAPEAAPQSEPVAEPAEEVATMPPPPPAVEAPAPAAEPAPEPTPPPQSIVKAPEPPAAPAAPPMPPQVEEKPAATAALTPPPAPVTAPTEHDETETAPQTKPNETVLPLPPKDDAAQTASLPPASGPLNDGDNLRIVFEEESSKLPQSARDALSAIADKMKTQDNLRLQLLAYAGDADTSASAARRLSLSRALAVRSFLIESGVRSTRIDVRALGNKSTEEVTERVDITVVER